MKLTSPITVTDRPPTDPAMPPPSDQEKRRKAAEDRLTRGPEREARAKALELAVATIDPTADPVPIAEVLGLAEAFRTYIVDGTVPAAPPAEAPGAKK